MPICDDLFAEDADGVVYAVVRGQSDLCLLFLEKKCLILQEAQHVVRSLGTKLGLGCFPEGHESFEMDQWSLRQDVDELLAKHRSSIDELKKRVSDVLPKDNHEYDDIFLLRYAMTWLKKGSSGMDK